MAPLRERQDLVQFDRHQARELAATVPAGSEVEGGEFRITGTGLEILGQPSPESCAAYMAYLLQMHNLTMLYVGDLALWMWNTYGEDITLQVLDVTGWQEETLRRAIRLCSRFPPGRRRSGVPTWVYEEIGALDHESQEVVLDEIEEEGYMPREEVRARRRVLRDDKQHPDEILLLVVHIRQTLDKLFPLCSEAEQAYLKNIHAELRDLLIERGKSCLVTDSSKPTNNAETHTKQS